MPTESKWEAPASIQTYLTTELNSLADGANKLGAKIDNVADGENEMFLNLELSIAAQASARASDARVEVFILYSLDDTNFDMGDDSTDPRPDALATVLLLDAATTARYRVAVNLPIAPLDFKILVINETGQAFAASGNTLKYRLHSVETQ
tara:strand:- start:2030 stop:2479 length:450 start_codon:yes stop_codon:yes gene_type:complete